MFWTASAIGILRSGRSIDHQVSRRSSKRRGRTHLTRLRSLRGPGLLSKAMQLHRPNDLGGPTMLTWTSTNRCQSRSILESRRRQRISRSFYRLTSGSYKKVTRVRPSRRPSRRPRRRPSRVGLRGCLGYCEVRPTWGTQPHLGVAAPSHPGLERKRGARGEKGRTPTNPTQSPNRPRQRRTS